MSKLYDERIDEVATAADGVPVRFRWRNRRYVVEEQVATWCRARDPAPRSRDAQLFRVAASPADEAGEGSAAAVCDLERLGSQWRLIRLWD